MRADASLPYPLLANADNSELTKLTLLAQLKLRSVTQVVDVFASTASAFFSCIPAATEPLRHIPFPRDAEGRQEGVTQVGAPLLSEFGSAQWRGVAQNPKPRGAHTACIDYGESQDRNTTQNACTSGI